VTNLHTFLQVTFYCFTSDFFFQTSVFQDQRFPPSLDQTNGFTFSRLKVNVHKVHGRGGPGPTSIAKDQMSAFTSTILAIRPITPHQRLSATRKQITMTTRTKTEHILHSHTLLQPLLRQTPDARRTPTPTIIPHPYTSEQKQIQFAVAS
jgi:hypothetical protein